MIKPVFLWSDIALFALIACLVVFIVQIRNNPLAKERWSSVFQSKVGMASFLVILFYASIAILDSFHYREQLPALEGKGEQTVAYSNEVHSVLDIVLSDLRSKTETTYSSPFSLYSFNKENMTAEDGSIYRDYPRLKHSGEHLNSQDEVLADVFVKSLIAIIIGLIVAVIPILAHRHWVRANRRNTDYPWHVAYITFAVLCVVSSWILYISQYYYIMGTDQVGADVLYQSIKAIRTGVLIGTLATIVTLPLAIILGICAGYFKGWVDDLIQYIYTVLSSIPFILLIAASVLLIDVYIETNSENFNLTILRSDFKFVALCAILGFASWTTLCRLLRAESLKVSQLDYVQAAHAFGVSHTSVIRRHILPNITHIILIVMVLDFSNFILAEAVLSYIGVGVDPNMHSWGNMINASRTELSRDPAIWWSVTSAFIFMFTLVLAANLLSDEVRNAFDPRTAKGN